MARWEVKTTLAAPTTPEKANTTQKFAIAVCGASALQMNTQAARSRSRTRDLLCRDARGTPTLYPSKIAGFLNSFFARRRYPASSFEPPPPC